MGILPDKYVDAVKWIAPGIAVSYLSKYLPENLRTAGYASGGGAVLYGIYKMIKEEYPSVAVGGTTPDGEEIIPEVRMLFPHNGEKVSFLLPLILSAEVGNPSYEYGIRGYMRFVLADDEKIYEYPTFPISIGPGDVKTYYQAALYPPIHRKVYSSQAQVFDKPNPTADDRVFISDIVTFEVTTTGVD